MFASFAFASRPFVARPRSPRPFVIEAIGGEYGWAAWSYSRQAKLNTWAWHGLGTTNVNGWATLGNAIYMRRESDDYLQVMQPDVFFAESDTNTESTSVEAVTQWLDFGKPGKSKALAGIDFDGQNVTTLEVYVSVGGSRTGTLAASIPIGTNDDGWTYNGEVISLEEVGAATEFMFRFVCDSNLEAQVNRFTVYYDEVAA